MTTSLVPDPFNDAMKSKIIELRKLTKNMEIADAEVLSEEQDKLREHFGTKKRPTCFAMAIAMITDLTNVKDWSDLKPQNSSTHENTHRIRNVYEREHDVSGNMLRCVCGQDIGIDTSYLYCNDSFSPVYLLVGQVCALKYKLVTLEQIKQLKKEKKAYYKKREMLKKQQELVKRNIERLKKNEKKYEKEKKRLEELRECRPYCRHCGGFWKGMGDTCIATSDDSLCEYI